MMKPRKQFHIDFLIDHIPYAREIGIEVSLYCELDDSLAPSGGEEEGEMPLYVLWRLTFDACWEGSFLYPYLGDPAI